MIKALESELLEGFCLQSETTAAFAVVFSFTLIFVAVVRTGQVLVK